MNKYECVGLDVTERYVTTVNNPDKWNGLQAFYSSTFSKAVALANSLIDMGYELISIRKEKP